MPSTFTESIVNKPPGFDFVAAHFACERDLYAIDNPSGYVNFGSAQNFLHTEEIESWLEGFRHDTTDARYQPFAGTDSCCTAVAAHLQDLATANGAAGGHLQPVCVSPEQLVVGNGVISLLEALAIALVEDDEQVLVPTPVFPGLVNALTLRTRLTVHLLHTDPDQDFRLTPVMLARELRHATTAGKKIGAVLLCSPGNPIGQVFSLNELQGFAAVAAEFECALIVDEVYAGSCFDRASFRSAIELDAENVYVLGGLSKDFGLAGFATGWLHTKNDAVRLAVAKQSHFFRLSAPVQRMMEHVLQPKCRNSYLQRHQTKLLDRFSFAIKALEHIGIASSPCEAGLCLWLDLRQFIDSHNTAGEMRLYRQLLDEHRLHVSPGTGFFTPHTGFYRICISQDEATLSEGLRRLATGLGNGITRPLRDREGV